MTVLRVFRSRRSGQRFLTLFANSVDDAVARYADQPGTDLLDRLRQTQGSHELVENVLEDVFCVTAFGYAPADEAKEASALARDDLRNTFALLGHQCR